MRRALALAAEAGTAGEVPVGAVVVRDGRVLGEAGNRREADADPTGHAELVALRRAAASGGGWRLAGATLYVTLEPCPMCAGAALSARLARVVYGAADPKAGALGSLYNLGADPRLNHELEVTWGVGEAEAARLLTEFFIARRKGQRA